MKLLKISSKKLHSKTFMGKGGEVTVDATLREVIPSLQKKGLIKAAKKGRVTYYSVDSRIKGVVAESIRIGNPRKGIVRSAFIKKVYSPMIFTRTLFFLMPSNSQ